MIEPRQLFNFIQGSDITGESSYDVWKRLGNEGSEADFLEFIRSGPKGDNGYVYALSASELVMKKGVNNVLLPGNITFKGYYRIGTEATRYDYTGRFVVQETTNGDTWYTKYTSSKDEVSIVYTPSSPNVKIIRCTLYAAGGTSTEIDTQTVVILEDVSNIEIGARNLLRNSDVYYEINKNSSNVSLDIPITEDNFDLQSLIGKTVTLSFYADTMGSYTGSGIFGISSTIIWSHSDGSAIEYATNPITMNSIGVYKQRVSQTITINPPSDRYDMIESFTINIMLSLKPSAVNDIWVFAHPKLEIGNIATDWTLAPEDEIQTINSTKTELKRYIDNAIGAEEQERDQAIDAAISSFESTVKDTYETIGNVNSKISSAVSNLETTIYSTVASESSMRTSAIASAISTEVSNRDSAIEAAKRQVNDFTNAQITNNTNYLLKYINERILIENVEVYVSPSGSDLTGDGTSSNPWRSISKAIENGPTSRLNSSFYTVNVAGGTYNENIIVSERKISLYLLGNATIKATDLKGSVIGVHRNSRLSINSDPNNKATLTIDGPTGINIEYDATFIIGCLSNLKFANITGSCFYVHHHSYVNIVPDQKTDEGLDTITIESTCAMSNIMKVDNGSYVELDNTTWNISDSSACYNHAFWCLHKSYIFLKNVTLPSSYPNNRIEFNGIIDQVQTNATTVDDTGEATES